MPPKPDTDLFVPGDHGYLAFPESSVNALGILQGVAPAARVAAAIVVDSGCRASFPRITSRWRRISKHRHRQRLFSNRECRKAHDHRPSFWSAVNYWSLSVTGFCVFGSSSHHFVVGIYYGIFLPTLLKSFSLYFFTRLLRIPFPNG